VQRFLDSLPYHLADTPGRPKSLQKNGACLEGAIFGAAALRVLGFPPLVWDLEAVTIRIMSSQFSKVRGAGAQWQNPTSVAALSRAGLSHLTRTSH